MCQWTRVSEGSAAKIGTFVSQTAHTTLDAVGLEYRRPRKMPGGRLTPYRLNASARVPLWLSRQVGLKDRWCIVPIDAIVAPPAFSYSADGWHPYSATLGEYSRNSALRYGDSSLARTYGQYLPRNASDALLASDDAIPRILNLLPPRFAGHEWVARHNEVDSALRGHPPAWMMQGHRVFGPVSDEAGRSDFLRLISVYESIKCRGYRTELTVDPISGYFLIDQREFRFRVSAGQHRLAAMKALGFQDVSIRLDLPIAVSCDLLSRRLGLPAWATSVDDVSRVLSEQMYGKGWSMARRWALDADLP